MKNIQYGFIVACLILFQSCSEVYEDPQFKKITNIKLKSKTLKVVNFDFSAMMYNPNIMGITLTSMDMELFYNETKLADVNQTLSTLIKAKSDFEVPMNVNVNTKDLLDQKSGLLGMALDGLVKKKVEILLKGTSTFDVVGLNIPVTIQDTVILNLK